MNTLSNTNKYRGFTLLEMMIVMTIFIILFAMSIAAFSGLRTTILTNQTAENFKINTRWTQRGAVLLKRDPGENWLYGLGLDFTEIQTEQTYRIFKWCSPYKEYSQGDKAQSLFPNFVDGDTLGPTSGNLPQGVNQWRDSCDPSLPGLPITDPVGYMVLIGGPDPDDPNNIVSRGDGTVGDFRIPEPLDVGLGPDGIAYIVFESISGRIFYYDAGGLLIGYHPIRYHQLISPEFVMMIADPDYEKGVKIRLDNLTGKVELEGANGTAEVTTDISF